jgi:hypothetical protein
MSLMLVHRTRAPCCTSALRQAGFLSQRTWGTLAVLVALLIVPYWIAKKVHHDKVQDGTASFWSCMVFACDFPAAKDPAAPSAAAQASAAKKAALGNKAAGASGVERSIPANTGPAAQAAAPSPDRFGLSFGHGDLQGKTGIIYSACAGAPLDMANPDKSQCNPYQGDSSCRTALPLLCILKDGSTAESAGLTNTAKAEGGEKPADVGFNFYAGWAGGTLGATAPVAGFVIGSLAQANARCEAELGASWRMAEFHDANGGWGLVGKRGQGLTSQQTRHWVHINDQKANCWDAEVK